MPDQTAVSEETVLNDLNAYLCDGIERVNGWCVPHLWQTIWPLRQLIGNGPIAEIGVFEGKFLIGLAKTFRSATGHAAIDVFDMKEFNLDGAGLGKLNVVKDNLAAHGIDNMRILKRDSLSLGDQDAANFWNAFGGFAAFSVDGCHTALHTINDVSFAMRVTRPDGVIAVDDYLNAHWPGVGEGIAKMYLMGSHPFVPFAFSCNKLFLCSYGRHARYLNAVEAYARQLGRARTKRVPRFGFETIVVMPDLKQSPALPQPARQSQPA